MNGKSARPYRSEGSRGTMCVLPSLLTTVSLFSGFYAIVAAIHGTFFSAAVALIVSGIFDCLDGRVARMTGTTSQFGKEYDSLCDLVAFGVAPAVIVYLWALEPYGRYGWLAAFLYVASTALRLARFNSQDGGSASYFAGLPCPAAAGTLAATVLFCDFWKISPPANGLVVLGLVYCLSYLMVSTVRYASFKKADTGRNRRFQTIVATVLVLSVIAAEPQVTLFVMAVLYILSGPFGALYRLATPACRTLDGRDHPV